MKRLGKAAAFGALLGGMILAGIPAASAASYSYSRTVVSDASGFGEVWDGFGFAADTDANFSFFIVNDTYNPNFNYIATLCADTVCNAFDPLNPPAHFVSGSAGVNTGSSSLQSVISLQAGIFYYMKVAFQSVTGTPVNIHYSVAFDFLDSPAAVTPIPPALAMFATSLGGLGLVGWRRRRARRSGMTTESASAS